MKKLSNEEEILLEQYITYTNMSKEERDFYVNLLLHTKEFDDSIIDNNESENKLIFLILNKSSNKVFFNGCMSNEKENKLLSGEIYRSSKGFVVIDSIYRMYEYLKDYERNYTSIDKFIFDKKIKRETLYDIKSGVFCEEIEYFNSDDLYDYYHDYCQELIEYKNKKLKKDII